MLGRPQPRSAPHPASYSACSFIMRVRVPSGFGGGESPVLWRREDYSFQFHVILFDYKQMFSLWTSFPLFTSNWCSSWVVNKTDSDLIEDCKNWKDAGAAHKMKGSTQKPGLEKGRTQGGAEALNSQTLELSSWGRWLHTLAPSTFYLQCLHSRFRI